MVLEGRCTEIRLLFNTPAKPCLKISPCLTYQYRYIIFRIFSSAAGFKTAFVHFSFDDKTLLTPYTSTNADMSSYNINWNGISLTDRKSPVVFCDGVGAGCIQVWKGLPCFK